MRTALLVVHVLAGIGGLVLGATAMLLPKRPGWDPRVASLYVGAVTAVGATAVGLLVFRPELWWLGLIAVATEVAAVAGWTAGARPDPASAGRSVRLLCMSYVSLVTAVLVVSVPVAPSWILPALVGEPLIHRAARAARGRAEGTVRTTA